MSKIISQDKELFNSKMEINIEGKDINHVVANTIRRTIFSKIPIFSFTEFEIKENTSIFNNDQLELRLKNMAIIGVKNDLVFLNEDEALPSLKQLTMYINYHNTSENIYSVTTDDVQFYYGGDKIDKLYKTPITLIKLQKNQKIKLSAITTVSTEESSPLKSIFSPVSVCYYNEEKDTKFTFVIESRGQLSETEIFNRAIDNINKDLDNLYELIPDKNPQKSSILLDNYDHTFGNLIARGLQDNSDIEFASYNMPHPLDNKIKINYNLKKGELKSTIKGIVSDYKKLFTKLKL
jgi:DNA-directed RNA polymerase subunit L